MHAASQDSGGLPRPHAAGQGFAHAAQGLSSLTDLQLSGCTAVTDAGLAVGVARLSQLRSLDLKSCSEFGDIGLAQLSRLTRLSALSTAGNRSITHRYCSSAGVARCLRPSPSKLLSLDSWVVMPCHRAYLLMPMAATTVQGNEQSWHSAAPIRAGCQYVLGCG